MRESNRRSVQRNRENDQPNDSKYFKHFGERLPEHIYTHRRKAERRWVRFDATN